MEGQVAFPSKFDVFFFLHHFFLKIKWIVTKLGYIMENVVLLKKYFMSKCMLFVIWISISLSIETHYAKLLL